MTTIAYRDGILASDSRAYAGENLELGEKQKIVATETVSGPALIGVSTMVPGLAERLWAWLEDGGEEDEIPDLKGGNFTALVIRPAGVFFYNSSPYPSGPLSAPYHAIGSGAQYALGAMHAGATAVTAVQAAKEMDVWSGGRTRMLETKNSWPG